MYQAGVHWSRLWNHVMCQCTCYVFTYYSSEKSHLNEMLFGTTLRSFVSTYSYSIPLMLSPYSFDFKRVWIVIICNSYCPRPKLRLFFSDKPHFNRILVITLLRSFISTFSCSTKLMLILSTFFRFSVSPNCIDNYK